MKLPPELYGIIADVYMPQYFRLKKEGSEEMYCSANTLIGLELLYDLYEKSTQAKEIEPIENLPKERKEKYWQLSAKYFKDKTDRTKSSKAMYMLDEFGAE